MLRHATLIVLITSGISLGMGHWGDDLITFDTIQERHDRALIADLRNYLQQSPGAEDRDRAYLRIFETAVDHDWFAENEPLAAAYLEAQPRGAVAPMARIVITMARARAGGFEAATEGFRQLLQTLDDDRPIAFAADFARTLAGEAVVAGKVPIAREVYGILLERFGSDAELRADIGRWLSRLDLVGQPAPDFRVRDLGGAPISLADFRGRYVLLDFWATWCEPCLADRPALRLAYDAHQADRLTVISVSLDDTADVARNLVRQRDWPWRQIHAATAGSDLVDLFRVEQLPASVLIGPDGTILRLDLKGKPLKNLLDIEPGSESKSR